MTLLTLLDQHKACKEGRDRLPKGWSRRTPASLWRDLNPSTLTPNQLQDTWWMVQCVLTGNDKALRLLACWCARWALALVQDPDQRCTHAVDVAERFACGGATADELREAHVAAWDARSVATMNALRAASASSASASAASVDATVCAAYAADAANAACVADAANATFWREFIAHIQTQHPDIFL